MTGTDYTFQPVYRCSKAVLP